MTAMLLIGAVVAGWMVQTYLTYRQSMAFNRQVAGLRSRGTISVGVGGNRYRGGRAFVAIVVDDRGIVRDAVVLSGWTTFSRGRSLPALQGVRLNKIRGDAPLPGLTKPQRAAARHAAELVKTHSPV